MKQILLSAALVVASTLPALAAPLGNGDVIFPTGTTFADPVHGGIQIVINDNLLNFRLDPTPASPLTDVGGAVQNRVTRNSGGTLNFAPRIRDTFNIDGGTFAITAFRLQGFGNANLDVDFRTDGAGDKGFTSVSRSVDGDLMTFRYDDPLLIDAIAPGRQEESLFPSIVSDATNFSLTGRMTVFGYLVNTPFGAPPTQASDLISVSFGGLAVPVAPVPLPASALLLAGGLFGLRLLKRKSHTG